MCSAFYDDHHHCYVEYKDGVSYPHHYPHAGHRFCPRSQHCEPHIARTVNTKNQLYGKALLDLSKKTEANLARLTHMMSQNPPRPVFQAWEEKEHGPVNTVWDDKQSVFTTQRQMDHIFWKSPLGDDWEDTSSSGMINKCYLCSTLDEHRQHLARRGLQLKPKPNAKPRILYIAPPPVVKPAKKEEEEKNEALYKVTVRTGSRLNAGTSGKVYITMHGKTQNMKKRQLCRRQPGNFCFVSGTSEVFYLKGPNVGGFRHITIERDNCLSSWFLEEVQVLNMSTDECWMFPFHQWLSSVKTRIRAQRTKIEQTEWEVRVFTADRRFAGTDANVFITLYGRRGVAMKQQLRTTTMKNAFERGKEDTFLITTNDVGPISKIRIEHDNSGIAPGWLLEKVTLVATENKQKYIFPCGEWLKREGDGEGELVKELFPLRKGEKLAGPRRKGKVDEGSDDGKRGKLLLYKLTVVTGDRSYAGTDARVFIKMTGKYGITQEVELKNSNHKDPFEKGKTDTFEVQAENVGNLKKLYVRHDNSHMAAGWFLEKIIVQRCLPKSEISDRLRKQRSGSDASRRASYEKQHGGYSDGSDTEDTTSSEDDSDEDKKGKLSTKWEQNRIPFCDEYVFPCDRWLADDEGDKQIARELTPATVTTLYKIQHH